MPVGATELCLTGTEPAAVCLSRQQTWCAGKLATVWAGHQCKYSLCLRARSWNTGRLSPFALCNAQTHGTLQVLPVLSHVNDLAGEAVRVRAVGVCRP